MEKIKYKRVHIFTFVSYVSRYFYLLIIPVIQYLLFNPQGVWETVSAVGINVLLIIGLTIVLYLSYKSKGYALDSGYLLIKKGFLIKRFQKISYDNIHTVTIQRNLSSAVFGGAYNIKLDLPSGIKSAADVTIYLSKAKLRELTASVFDVDNFSFKYRAEPIKIIFMAALWSNSVSGLLIAAPFIKKIGVLLGERFADELYTTVDTTYILLSMGLPPAAAAVGNVLILGWAVAMVAQLSRYIGFNAGTADNTLIIRRGFVNKSYFFVDNENINTLSVRQSIFMLPFRLYSAYIYTVGAGKSKGDKSLLVAAEKKRRLKEVCKVLLGEALPEFSDTVSPDVKSLIGCLALPGAIFAANTLFICLLGTVGGYDSVLYLILVFLVPVELMWIIFRIYAHFNSGLSVNDNYLCISNYNRLTLSHNYIKKDKLQFYVIQQNFFQKIGKTCTLKLYVFSEGGAVFKLKRLPVEKTRNIMKNSVFYERD